MQELQGQTEEGQDPWPTTWPENKEPGEDQFLASSSENSDHFQSRFLSGLAEGNRCQLAAALGRSGSCGQAGNRRHIADRDFEAVDIQKN